MYVCVCVCVHKDSKTEIFDIVGIGLQSPRGIFFFFK